MTNEQLQRRVNEIEMKEMASECLRGARLHEMTRTRIIETATKNIPLQSDGSLNKAALKQQLTEALKEEQDYLSQISGRTSSGYRGSSESLVSEAATIEDFEEAWTKALMAQGLNEVQAKAGAKYQHYGHWSEPQLPHRKAN